MDDQTRSVAEAISAVEQRQRDRGNRCPRTGDEQDYNRSRNGAVLIHGGYPANRLPLPTVHIVNPGELAGVHPTIAVLISVVVVNMIIRLNLAVDVKPNFYGEFVGAVINPAINAVSDAVIGLIVDTMVVAAITDKLVKNIQLIPHRRGRPRTWGKSGM